MQTVAMLQLYYYSINKWPAFILCLNKQLRACLYNELRFKQISTKMKSTEETNYIISNKCVRKITFVDILGKQLYSKLITKLNIMFNLISSRWEYKS